MAQRFALALPGVVLPGVVLAGMVLAAGAGAGEPVGLRVANMAVAPAHMPAVKVWIENRGEGPYEGELTLRLPEGWTLDPASQRVSLKAGETSSASFTIHDARTLEENRYPVSAVARGDGGEVCRTQEIVCASAPYFKPEIDGRSDDWKDAIPVTFVTGGKGTSISTYWNRRQFAMLVGVEEQELAPRRPGEPFDAVQVAISAQGTATSTTADGQAGRWEFLLTAGGAGEESQCFQLAQPGTKLAETLNPRPLKGLEADGTELAVWREGNTTWYEWGVSFRDLADIRPGEGREFCLSVLVHDPEGTGLRDWGQAAGLWPSQRSRLAWSDWEGASWPKDPPMDNKVEWGMCSSKY
ncbi:MAG: COG1470 family protein [Thermoguttaceae bacterium]